MLVCSNEGKTKGKKIVKMIKSNYFSSVKVCYYLQSLCRHYIDGRLGVNIKAILKLQSLSSFYSLVDEAAQIYIFDNDFSFKKMNCNNCFTILTLYFILLFSTEGIKECCW